MFDRYAARQVLVHGPLELDPERWIVRVHHREIDVSPRQFKLLRHLMRRPGRVWTRDELIDAVWDPREEDDTSPQVVDVLVCRLRRQLGDAAGLLETVRSVGYRLKTLKE